MISSMMSLVIHLVMQSDVGADKSLDFLLRNATVSNGKYHTCDRSDKSDQ